MLIVEDGSIVDGANSYISVADADSYISNNITSSKQILWNDLIDEDKEIQLANSTEFVDLFVNWNSEILEIDQPLNWPRNEFLDTSKRKVKNNEVPEAVVNAVAEIAVEDLQNDIHEEPVKLKSQSFGDSSETYAGTYFEGGNKVIKKIKNKLTRLGLATKTNIITLQRA